MADPAAAPALVRPMVHADLVRVLGWRNAPQVRRYMYTQHEITLDEHQRWFAAALHDPRKHPLIFELDHVPLGFVNFTEIAAGGIADWGFYASPEAPKGSGSQLGRSALRYAFGELGLHKVCGQALAHNQRSIQLHLGLGFHQEGTRADQHFDGARYHDVVCFGLLAHLWQPTT